VSAFEALTSGAYGNFALLSCFVDGHPAAAIIAVNRQGETFTLTPPFVSVTGAMVPTDHAGQAPAPPA
jgi:hypothetical protein